MVHFFTFLGIFQLWGAVSRVNMVQNSKFLQNSNSPYQIYPKSHKLCHKNSFGRFLFFTIIFWQSDIWFRFLNSPQHHQFGSNGVSMDKAHVGAHFGDRTANKFHVLKYQDSSKFKIVIFWRFFDLDPTWTLDLWPSNYVSRKRPRIHTNWQNFSSLALRLPVQKLLWQSALASALVTTKSVTSIFFLDGFLMDLG